MKQDKQNIECPLSNVFSFPSFITSSGSVTTFSKIFSSDFFVLVLLRSTYRIAVPENLVISVQYTKPRKMFGLLLNLALVSASILSRNVQQPAEAEALDGSSITVLPGGAGLRATGLLSMHRRRDVATSTLYQRQLMSDIAQDHKSHSSQQTQHKHQKSKSGSNTQKYALCIEEE